MCTNVLHDIDDFLVSELTASIDDWSDVNVITSSERPNLSPECFGWQYSQRKNLLNAAELQLNRKNKTNILNSSPKIEYRRYNADVRGQKDA